MLVDNDWRAPLPSQSQDCQVTQRKIANVILKKYWIQTVPAESTAKGFIWMEIRQRFVYRLSKDRTINTQSIAPLAWENSRHLGTPPVVSSQNDVWGTILRPVSASDWLNICFIQSEALPRSLKGHVISIADVISRETRGGVAAEMSAVSQSCLLRVNDFAKRFYFNGDTIGYCPQL